MTPDQIKETYIQNFTKHASDIVANGLKEVGLPESALTSITTTLVKSYTLGWNDREVFIPIDRARPKTNQRILIKYRTLHHNETPDPDVQIATLHMANSFVQITDEVLAYPGEFIWYIPALRKYLPFGAVMEWMFIPGHDYTEK